ncbi:MAG: hypothetical protein UH084_05580 [Paludibacteraceae bacterium]|nr:hypothetical protein [Paludibacteraceae bacterium]
MTTNPVIQGVAVGGVIAVGATVGTSAYTWALTSGWQMFMSMPFVQFVAGFAEGWSKGKMSAGPDLPYLNESPVFQAGSSVGSLLYEIFH